MTIHLQPSQVPAFLRGDYPGKKFTVEVCEKVYIPADAGTWDSGSRTKFFAVKMATGERVPLTESYTAPWSATRSDRDVTITPGYAVVKHHQYGSHESLAIYCHAADAAPLLPAPIHLTDDERAVLSATANYKSSYMGRDRYTMSKLDDKHRLTRVEWNMIRDRLASRKLLTKAGAITVDGRNALTK